MKLWYEKLEFKKNPFSIKPTDYLIGNEQVMNDLKENIIENKISVLWGLIGSGKSTVTEILKNEFKKNYKLILLNGDKLAHPDSNTDLKKILPFQLPFLKKPIVLILDESQSAPEHFFIQIKGFKDDDTIHSVVFAQVEPTSNKMPLSLIDRIGKNFIQMNPLKEIECIELINKRLGDKKLLEEETLKKIISFSKNIPRSILVNCEDFCKLKISKLEKEELLNLEDYQYWLERENKSKKTIQDEKEKRIKKVMETSVKNILKLSPLQEKILLEIGVTSSTTKELSERLETSIPTLTKQLSILNKKNHIVVMKNEGEPKKYKAKPETWRQMATK